MNYFILLWSFLLFTYVYGQWPTTFERKRINEEAVEPKWHWVELPLDHFNVLDNRTFKARYLTNDQFYKKGGPIIVYIGGEWEIANYGIMGGVAFQLARKHNGYLFYPEHRYFGKSLPFSMPVSTENLRYITPDYSLADLVYTTSYLKQSVEGLEDSRVVLVGGSYAGSLAIWGRLKYPHTMSLAYNCGGVARTSMFNTDYFSAMYKGYERTSPRCIATIISALKEAMELTRTKKGNAKFMNMWAEVLHFDAEARYSLLQMLPFYINFQVWPVYKSLQLCHFLEVNTTGSPLDRLLQTHLAITAPSTKDSNPDRHWEFLVCAFLGNIMTTNSSNFGTLLESSHLLNSRCTKEFGLEINQDFVNRYTERTTKLYGSATPDIRKVLSVQGTHDPWKSETILDDLNDKTPVVYIEGANHCLEIGEEQHDETPQVFQAKIEILNQLSCGFNKY